MDNIDRSFGVYRYFKPPFNKKIFSTAEKVLAVVPEKLKSTEYLHITNRQIESFDGYLINIHIFEPTKVQTDKAYLYIHGGGFVFKGYESHYNVCERFALEGNCKVVYVDYRLANNYKYPVPVEDSYAAYKWIIENANNLLIDTNKIIVGGDSAGGCLAVDVTMKAIEENNIIPCGMMLHYPVLDKRMKTASMEKYTNTPMWNAKLNRKMWEFYLDGKDYISPNERKNFKGVPDTYIETAEYDCLHDEAVEFYEKLKKAGINVTLNETKGTMHGFDIKKCDKTEDAIQQRISMLKKFDKVIS